MSEEIPRLSVIVAVMTPLSEAMEPLREIAKQGRGQDAEILAAYGSETDDHTALQADFPEVRFLRLPQGATLPQLLGAGVAQAKGDLLAICDASYRIDNNWIAAVLKAHEAPHPILGGAVDPGALRSLTDWTAYFCDYGQFMRPLTEGVVREIPGSNFTVKRCILANGRQYIAPEFWKTYWCRQMQSEGVDLYSDPSLVVYYQKSFGLFAYLAHRFHNGRCFAGMRLQQLSLPKRLLYALGSSVLPLLFCRRILQAQWSKRRYRQPLFLALPLLFVAAGSWAFGEFVGYLSGPGASCAHVK